MFPYENWMMREVYAHLHPEDPFFDKSTQMLNYPVYTLGYEPELDDLIIESKKIPNIKYFHSTQVKKPYVANYCPHCQRAFGRYYLLENITDYYLSSNKPLTIEYEL